MLKKFTDPRAARLQALRTDADLRPVLEASLRCVTQPKPPVSVCNHAAHRAQGASVCPDCIAATAMAELAAQAQALDLGYPSSRDVRSATPGLVP
jgi:hypothetical protein